MEILLIIIIVRSITGGIAAAIASSKGRSGVGWFFGGFFLDIIGIVIVACISNLKVEEARRRHVGRESRRLREQLHQERMKNESFRQHAVGRLDVHDDRLGVDTRYTQAGLPSPWGGPAMEDPGSFLAKLEQQETQPVRAAPMAPVAPVTPATPNGPPPLAGRRPPAPEKAPRQWFYEVSGQTMGPVTERKLVSMLRARQIDGTTLLWTEELGDWKEARRIGPLLRYIQS